METISRVTRENEVLKDEVKRLRMELEEAKMRAAGFHGDSLINSAVGALVDQVKSLSTLVFEQDRYSGFRNLGGVIKKY